MPFGLTNILATFWTLMNQLFEDYIGKFLLVFFDDLLLYNKTKSDHLQHLRLVLEKLRTENLFANMKKRSFAEGQVEYLGHIISSASVATDPKKIEAVQNWPTPQNKTQLRGFLGIAGYYRCSVKTFGLICHPLRDMLKKDSFDWTTSQSVAFEQLKTSLVSALLCPC
jgi:hypothetical protein